ncbi:hypothetical protein, partial [Cardiobacterium hominis]|uniref:hypothetical protein n=1 Tax=Cardiobacterium hominis TaxID=2718 RepID=UPI0028D07899
LKNRNFDSSTTSPTPSPGPMQNADAFCMGTRLLRASPSGGEGVKNRVATIFTNEWSTRPENPFNIYQKPRTQIYP